MPVEVGVSYHRSVQPAYTSQQCSQYGFTISMNRRSKAVFHCQSAVLTDENPASNIAERFSDKELALAIRFLRRLPVARSASAGLESTIPLDVPRGNVAAQPLPPTVNQPGLTLIA